MFFPWLVDVPMARWPVANWVLIGLTIIVSLALLMPYNQWVDDRDPTPQMEPGKMYPVEMRDGKLVAIVPPKVIVERPSIVDRFMLEPEHFRSTQLVGHLFMHASIMHLLGNMLFLFVFGNAVNAKLGNAVYVVLYLGMGVLAGVAWLVIGPRNPCLGASGAIMGVVGAFLLLYPLNDITMVYFLTLFRRGTFQLSAMWVIAAYAAFDLLGLMRHGGTGVAYLSHVVGFGLGAVSVTVMLATRWVEMDRSERSLLQVFKLMRHDEDVAGAVRLRAAAGVSGTARPAGAIPTGGTRVRVMRESGRIRRD